MVDDFGKKYTNQADVGYLINAVRDKYPFRVDWEAKQYIGIQLKWDYNKRELCTSMEGYVEQALKQFTHTTPKQHCKDPSRINRPVYLQAVQYVKIDTSPVLSPAHIKFVQCVTGKFLFMPGPYTILCYMESTTYHPVTT